MKDFIWVDAFTNQPFGGNPCSVVFDTGDVPVEARLAYTRETRLSECSFMVPSDVADFGARYYVASRELPFAGHPTVATGVALVEMGLVSLADGPAEITLEVGAGVVPLTIAPEEGGPRVTMMQPQPKFGREYPRAEIAALVGLTADDILHPPQTVDNGPQFCITVLRDKDALRRAKLDTEAMRALRPEVDFAEPFLVTLGGVEGGDTFSRLMMVPPEPEEDPFTGSATGSMAAYLWSRGLIDRPDLIAEQGHWVGRPGQARARVIGPRDAIETVEVSGQGVVVMQGAAAL